MERLVVRVEALLSALDQAVIATDLDGTVLFWNPAAERLYGWSPEEAVGRNVNDLVVVEADAALADQIMEAVGAGRRWSGEFPVRRRSGDVFIASVTDNPVLGEDGGVVGVVGVSSDVNEKRWAEALRRGSRGGLSLALTAARVGTWHWDLASGVVEWDAAMESLYGLAVGSFSGTIGAWLDRVHPDDRDRLSAAVEQAVDDGDELTVELRLPWPDGSSRWVETRGRVTRDEEGRVRGCVGVAVDATDRKQAEQALREEHQIVETLHHIGRSLVAELDLERIVQAVTDAGTLLTGAQLGAYFSACDDGEHVELVTLAGVDRSVFESFPRPRRTEVLGPTFADEGAVRLDDVTADPRFGRNPPYFGLPPGHPPVRSYLAVPVVSRSGEVLGGLVFGHERAGVFDESDERLVSGIASHAAIAIDNGRLLAAAEVQRHAAVTAANRLARLHALAVRLGTARSADAVAEAVVAEGAAAVGSVATSLCGLTADGAALEILASSGVSDDAAAGYRTIALDAATPINDAFRQRTAVLLRSTAERDASYPGLAGVRAVGRSFAAVPVEVQGRPFGVLAVSFPDERDFTEDDRSLLDAVALQGGQALGRARLADAERRAARTLQQSLLPPGELRIPGLEVATRYHAFGDETEVGGDFYDAFALGDGSGAADGPDGPGAFGVVMGDVRGKGIQSAAVTALARYTVRAASQCDRRPSEALALVNRAIYEQDDPERFCTVVHLHLRPAGDGSFDVELAVAGHPLPLLMTPAGEVRAVGRTGTVVGLFADPELHDVRERLTPGDALVLFTDGVLEARSPDGRFAPDLIEKALRDVAGHSAEDIAAAVERAVLRFEGGQARDDMALLVLRVPDVAPDVVPEAV